MRSIPKSTKLWSKTVPGQLTFLPSLFGLSGPGLELNSGLLGREASLYCQVLSRAQGCFLDRHSVFYQFYPLVYPPLYPSSQKGHHHLLAEHDLKESNEADLQNVFLEGDHVEEAATVQIPRPLTFTQGLSTVLQRCTRLLP